MDALTETVFVLDGHSELSFLAHWQTSKVDEGRHDVDGSLHVVVEDRGDHRVGLVDQLTEGLLLLNGLHDHLMLALFTHLFDARSLHVLSIGHRADLDPAVCDTLGCDELLVELTWHVALRSRLDIRLILPQLAEHIEVLGLDHMVLLSLQDLLLLELLQVLLLLHVERCRGLGRHLSYVHLIISGLFTDTSQLLALVDTRLVELILWFQGNDWVVSVDLSLIHRLVLGVATSMAIAVKDGLDSLLVGLLLRAVDALAHSHKHLVSGRLDWVLLVVLHASSTLVVLAHETRRLLHAVEGVQSAVHFSAGMLLLGLSLLSSMLLKGSLFGKFFRFDGLKFTLVLSCCDFFFLFGDGGVLLSETDHVDVLVPVRFEVQSELIAIEWLALQGSFLVDFHVDLLGHVLDVFNLIPVDLLVLWSMVDYTELSVVSDLAHLPLVKPGPVIHEVLLLHLVENRVLGQVPTLILVLPWLELLQVLIGAHLDDIRLSILRELESSTDLVVV